MAVKVIYSSGNCHITPRHHSLFSQSLIIYALQTHICSVFVTHIRLWGDETRHLEHEKRNKMCSIQHFNAKNFSLEPKQMAWGPQRFITDILCMLRKLAMCGGSNEMTMVCSVFLGPSVVSRSPSYTLLQMWEQVLASCQETAVQVNMVSDLTWIHVPCLSFTCVAP